MKNILVVLLGVFFSIQTISAQNNDIKGLYIVVGDLGLTSALDLDEAEKNYKRFGQYIFQNVRGKPENMLVIFSTAQNKVVWEGTARDFVSGSESVYEKFIDLGYTDRHGKNHRGKATAKSDLKKSFEKIKDLEKKYAPLNFSQTFMFSPFIDTVTAMKDAPINAKGQLVYDIIEVIESNKANLKNFISLSDVEGVQQRKTEIFWVDEEIEPVVVDLFKGNDSIDASIYTKTRTKTLLK